MWILEKNSKIYTCPKGNLKTIAYIQAMDRGIKKGPVHDDESAKKYLESLGFKISCGEEEEPLTEVPAVPQYGNRQHRELYNKLFYQDIGRPLTEEENEFCKAMYHMEEVACGLDGDR